MTKSYNHENGCLFTLKFFVESLILQKILPHHAISFVFFPQVTETKIREL